MARDETYETVNIVPLVRAVALAAGRREKHIDITAYHNDDIVVRLHRMANLLEQVDKGHVQLTRVV